MAPKLRRPAAAKAKAAPRRGVVAPKRGARARGRLRRPAGIEEEEPEVLVGRGLLYDDTSRQNSSGRFLRRARSSGRRDILGSQVSTMRQGQRNHGEGRDPQS